MNKNMKQIMPFGKSDSTFQVSKKVKTTFKDVAGQEQAKLEITEFVEFLKNPQKFSKLGATIPKGALLSGPPGNGKTLLAKACAGEAGVPFISVSGSQFVEMYVGVGSGRVRSLFELAKKQNKPTIIFIDEIDAIGKKRDERHTHSEQESTLNQLLVEMDGFDTDNNILILGATNRADMLDPALLRPGRFNRQVEIIKPTLEARKLIFQTHLEPLKITNKNTKEYFARRLACLTPGFSGAEIANICNESAILAVRNNQSEIIPQNFEDATEKVIAGIVIKNLLSEEEKEIVAYHEAGHAVVSWFLEFGDPLLKVTILPRSKGALGFAQYLPNETNLHTKKYLQQQINCLLGGICSEKTFFGRTTNGASNDLERAYQLARDMTIKYGMSDIVGHASFTESDHDKSYSQYTNQMIDDSVKEIIQQQTEETMQLIEQYKDKIQSLAQELYINGSLDLKSIILILGERQWEPQSNFKEYLEIEEEKKDVYDSEDKQGKEDITLNL